jgi:hypothetical protein
MSIKKVGTYTTNAGDALKLLRSEHDPKHHMLSNAKGQVVKSFHKSTEDVHTELTTGPHKLTGALHEEEQLDELSKSTLANYMVSAGSSRASLGRKEIIASYMKKDNDEAAKHAAKNSKRFEGMLRARKRLQSEEAEQIDELSTKTLSNYSRKAQHVVDNTPSDSKAHKKSAVGVKLADSKLLRSVKMEEVEHKKKTLGSILEEIKRGRGRPKKKRNMLGQPVDDDDGK